ncbi:hypothetical protein OMF40_13050, partial [Bordetella pertussis]
MAGTRGAWHDGAVRPAWRRRLLRPGACPAGGRTAHLRRRTGGAGRRQWQRQEHLAAPVARAGDAARGPG